MNRKENHWRPGDGYFHGASGRGHEMEFDGPDEFREGSFTSFGDEARWKSDRGFQHYNEDHFERNNQMRSWYKHTDTRDVYDHQSKGPVGYTLSDERIYEDVCQALTDSREVDATEIEVSVEDHIVTLTGTVESKFMKFEAEWIIDRLAGVEDIVNLLRTRGEALAEDVEEEGALGANPVIRREEASRISQSI